MGYPALKTILDNRLVPGYVDRYLAENGFDSQQYNGPVEPDRQSNLWEPVPGDHGAHGDFDSRAPDFSPQLWAATHRRSLGTVLGGLGALAFYYILKARRN